MASPSRKHTPPNEEVKTKEKDLTTEKEIVNTGSMQPLGSEPVVLKDMDGNEIKINNNPKRKRPGHMDEGARLDYAVRKFDRYAILKNPLDLKPKIPRLFWSYG